MHNLDALRRAMKFRSILVSVPLCLIVACLRSESVAPRTSLASDSLPLTVTPVATRYPLKISSNGRYLVDRENKPFRIQGDSAQSLMVNLTHAEAETYLSDRQAKGFNSVNINLLEHKFGVKAPANRNGDAPFTRPGDFSTPNEAYFAFADSIIDLAASKGMLVSLAAMYLGVNGGDEGWWSALTNRANSQAVCYRFGQYVGNRYKNRPNILWVIGGDFTPPAGSEGETRLRKFMDGIKDAGATQLWAGDWKAPCISTDVRAFASSMDMNAVYTYGSSQNDGLSYIEASIAYQYSPPHPAYLKETGYEEENWIPGDRTSVRKYEYWAVLGGATAGAFFGHRDIWEFATANWSSGFFREHGLWQKALNSAGTLDMMRLGLLLDAVPWYDLVPSGLAGSSPPVTSGGGTFGKQDFVTATADPRGTTLVVYVPPAATSAKIAINMKTFSGPASARWFDPTSGKYANVRGGPFANRGAADFIVPGVNSDGAKDWVLVLRTGPKTVNKQTSRFYARSSH
jgi:hypothetical protein